MSSSRIVGPVAGKDEKKGNPLQMNYPEEIYPRRFATLPSNIAIPVGLAQVMEPNANFLYLKLSLDEFERIRTTNCPIGYAIRISASPLPHYI